MNCCAPASRAIAGHFDASVAEGDRRSYNAHGPDKRARRLIDGLERVGVKGRTVLDVGSGIGVISLELLKRGAAAATLADASPSYLAAARAEGHELGLANRLQFVEGDFVDTAPRLQNSDVVVMDRAVCCYPHWRPLLTTAAGHARQTLALTYPRDRVDVRLMIGLDNLRRRWAKDDFRAFVHSPDEMEAALEASGFRRVHRAQTVFWRIEVYRRAGE
jgi:SAM-dependent methyltransferase